MAVMRRLLRGDKKRCARHVLMGIRTRLAGRGGRKDSQGFITNLATAKGAPGNPSLGITEELAGRGGRKETVGVIL